MTRASVLLSALLFWTGIASGAVSIEGIGSAGAAPSSTISFSVDCGSNPNRVIVAGVGISSDTAVTVSSASYNGVALSLKQRHNGTSHLNAAELWYLGGAASGTNTLQINLSASEYAAAWAICFSGADPTLGGAAVSNVTGETINVDVTGISGGMIIDLHVKNGLTDLSSPGSGQTLQVSIDDAGSSSCGNNICVQASTSTETGTVTMDWSTAPGNAAFLNMIAVPISPASAPVVAQRHRIIVTP